jgi:hypothetical protein
MGTHKILTIDNSSVSFPALHTVTMGDLIIINSFVGVEPETSMNISLPALNSSDSIFIHGRASRYVHTNTQTLPAPILRNASAKEVNNSISFPELTYLASPWLTGSGSNFSLWGETIELDLPKLHTVDGSIYFEGNITAFVVPILPHTGGG